MPIDRTSIESASMAGEQPAGVLVDELHVVTPEQFADAPEAVAEDAPIISSFAATPDRAPVAMRIINPVLNLTPEIVRVIQEQCRRIYGMPAEPTPARPALTPAQQRIADALARANASAHERQDAGIVNSYRRHGA